MTGPLEDITILDLSCDVPGAYACMLLGDMGARVIKAALAPWDAGAVSPAFRLWDRGKQSVALDYSKSEGRNVLNALVQRADVLVETFRPEEVQALKIEYEVLKDLNPRLVYCALPPFGDQGPLSNLPADSGVIDAHAGVYGDQGGPGLPPVFIHLPISYYSTAMMATYAISTALFARELTGQGQKIELSWYSSIMAVQSHLSISGTEAMTRYRQQRNQLGSNPLYRLYKAQDGWFFLACGHNVFWNKLCIALGLEHLTADDRLQDAPWAIPMEHHSELVTLLEGIFREKPRGHWLGLLKGYGIPAGPVKSRSEFMDHPQVIHNGVLVDVDDPVLGKTTQMGVLIQMEVTPGSVTGPAPLLGQHTEEILGWLGYSLDEVLALERDDVIKRRRK